MKAKYVKPVLLTVFFLLNVFLLKPQQEPLQKVFPTSDAMWSVFVFGRQPTQHYIYGLTGDTIINKKEYSKLYLLNDSTLWIDKNDIYVGGIRQQDKIVYLQPATNKWGDTLEEFILYNFSKTVGDVISVSRPYDDPLSTYPTFEEIIRVWHFENVIILKDEETQFGRKIICDMAFGQEWIEGIGSLSGFFFSSPTYANDGSGVLLGGILTCMMENGEIKYKDEYNCTSCFGPLRYDYNSIVNNTIEDIVIYYDPVSRQIKVRSAFFPLSFNLYSISGNLAINILSLSVGDVIDVSFLSEGIYIYQITGHTLKTGKLIIH